jgi:hypothetical protein
MPVLGTERAGFHAAAPATRGRSGRTLHSVSEPSYSRASSQAGNGDAEDRGGGDLGVSNEEVLALLGLQGHLLARPGGDQEFR